MPAKKKTDSPKKDAVKDTKKATKKDAKPKLKDEDPDAGLDEAFKANVSNEKCFSQRSKAREMLDKK